MKVSGGLIRKHRIARGLTQQDLVVLSGLSRRTIVKAESGEVGVASLAKLAEALKVKAIDLTKDIAKLSNSREGPRILLESNLPDADYDIARLLRDAVVDEFVSDFESAIQKFGEAGKLASGKDIDLKAEIIVRLGTALDNAGRNKEALKLLEPLLSDRKWGTVKPWVKRWAKYHVALANRRLAEGGDPEPDSRLKCAKELFEQVGATGDLAQRVAATHQLGCLYLVRERLSKEERDQSAFRTRAVKELKSAASKWKEIGDFREGYSLRRLAEIAMRQGESLSAYGYWLDALEVFARHDAHRYRDEVRARLDEWGRKREDG